MSPLSRLTRALSSLSMTPHPALPTHTAHPNQRTILMHKESLPEASLPEAGRPAPVSATAQARPLPCTPALTEPPLRVGVPFGEQREGRHEDGGPGSTRSLPQDGRHFTFI